MVENYVIFKERVMMDIRLQANYRDTKKYVFTVQVKTDTTKRITGTFSYADE